MQNNIFSKITISIIAIALCYSFYTYKVWRTDNVFASDSGFYYGYLPTAFIYKDFSLKYLDYADIPNGVIYPDRTPDGTRFFKMSCGLSILYSPFFFIGHLSAKIFHYPATGFSEPYKIAILLSSICCVLLGLTFLRKLLLQKLDDYSAGITMLCIVLGTNLFYYSTREASMSHAFSFSLICIFLYQVFKWYQSFSVKRSIFIGIIYGLISLIRPTNSLIIFVFLFYNISSFQSLKERSILLFKKYQLVFIIAASAFIIWIPQMMYWNYISGHFLFYSYQNEKFFWSRPHLIDGLFSYRKGWLLYTPIMTIAIAGMFFMKKKFPEFFTGAVLYLSLIFYVLMCWWCWWYGGSFSQRSFIDFYGLLAIPFVALVSVILNNKIILLKTSALLLFAVLIWHNIFETEQYHNGAINFDSMTKNAYWGTFLKSQPYDGWYDLLKTPDYENAKAYGIEMKLNQH